MSCSRVEAKLRIASSHDILIGHGSMSGWSKTGRRRSQASLLSVAGEALDSCERIFPTIAQNERAKRVLIRIECADSHDLANIFPIDLWLASRGTCGGVSLERDKIFRARQKHTLAGEVHLFRAFD